MTQLDLLTSLAADTPANPFPRPGSNEARTMTAHSGRHLLRLYENSNQPLLLAKTLLVTLRWGSMICALRWKEAATPSRRLIFRLSPLMPDTDDKDYGLLPTPAVDARGRNKSASPNAKIRPGLEMMARVGLWPTPIASDWKGSVVGETLKRRQEEMTRGVRLPEAIARLNGQHGRLNPAFVEWLMGYPIGWTDLKD